MEARRTRRFYRFNLSVLSVSVVSSYQKFNFLEKLNF
jgi:hypothetical protein